MFLFHAPREVWIDKKGQISNTDTLESVYKVHALWATLQGQWGGSVKAECSNSSIEIADAGIKLFPNCVSMCFISQIYFPCFKLLVYVRNLKQIIPVHFKRASSLLQYYG